MATMTITSIEYTFSNGTTDIMRYTKTDFEKDERTYLLYKSLSDLVDMVSKRIIKVDNWIF